MGPTITFKKSRLGSAILATMVLTITPVNSSMAETAIIKPLIAPKQIAAQNIPTKTTVAGQGSARFNWLATPSNAAPQRVAQTRFYGNGSWICSPAGFGKKSQCYRR